MGALQSLSVDLKIIVKTGDVKGAGTDSNVYCSLTDDKGNKSRDILLDVIWRNDFEKGNIDTFNIRGVPNIGDIQSIELWRDQRGIKNDWFVEYIIVEKPNHISPFPCHRWIEANKKYVFYIYDSSLPQYDQRIAQRKEELEAKKIKYTFSNTANGIPKQVNVNIF